MDFDITAPMRGIIRSMIQDRIDHPPDPCLAILFDAYDGYNRDVERWASLKYRDERRHAEWVDIGGRGRVSNQRRKDEAVNTIKILDHGSLRLIESWGSDERIIEAARMSTGKGFTGWGPKCRHCGDLFDDPERDCPSPDAGIAPLKDSGRGGHRFDAPGDEKLLKYLYDNHHATPFEMAGAVFEVEAPIFVFREWHRHRTQSYNEMSARYTPLPNVNYIPMVDRLMINSQTNKQAGTIKGAGILTEQEARMFQASLGKIYQNAQDLYESALNAGVPKELARVHLPVGRYSRMRASAVLRNWLAFLTLRMAPGAQWEIRQYANAVHDLLVEVFPRTLALFDGKA